MDIKKLQGGTPTKSDLAGDVETANAPNLRKLEGTRRVRQAIKFKREIKDQLVSRAAQPQPHVMIKTCFENPLFRQLSLSLVCCCCQKD